MQSGFRTGKRAIASAATTVALALFASLPSPAAAWQVSSPTKGVYRIERESGDASGTVRIYRTAGGMNAALENGSWDDTSTNGYQVVLSPRFDDDDWVIELNAPVFSTVYYYLLFTPEGAYYLTPFGTPRGTEAVYITDSGGALTSTLPVSLSSLPTMSLAGTPAVAVSSYPTPPAAPTTMSVDGTVPVTVVGTVPVDPFWQTSLPEGWAGTGVSLVTLLSGFGSAVVFRRV